jgi:thiamine biosynthesis protein ThiS
MHIMINGKDCPAPMNCTAAELMEYLGYKSKTSIWVNGTQLLLSQYGTWKINDGDQIKLIRVVGGG